MIKKTDWAKTFHNQSGFILATVILFTLILTVVAISVMSLNVSQTTSGQSVVDTIKAEQLAIGAFYQQHQSRIEDCQRCPTQGDCSTCQPDPETLDSKTFFIDIYDYGEAADPNFNKAHNIIANISY